MNKNENNTLEIKNNNFLSKKSNVINNKKLEEKYIKYKGDVINQAAKYKKSKTSLNLFNSSKKRLENLIPNDIPNKLITLKKNSIENNKENENKLESNTNNNKICGNTNNSNNLIKLENYNNNDEYTQTLSQSTRLLTVLDKDKSLFDNSNDEFIKIQKREMILESMISPNFLISDNNSHKNETDNNFHKTITESYYNSMQNASKQKLNKYINNINEENNNVNNKENDTSNNLKSNLRHSLSYNIDNNEEDPLKDNTILNFRKTLNIKNRNKKGFKALSNNIFSYMSEFYDAIDLFSLVKINKKFFNKIKNEEVYRMVMSIVKNKKDLDYLISNDGMMMSYYIERLNI